MKAFNQRRLMKASNIVNCSRINLASKAFPSQNDNITHHATVPLKSGQEQFGILNVASPNTEIYSDEDLELLVCRISIRVSHQTYLFNRP